MVMAKQVLETVSPATTFPEKDVQLAELVALTQALELSKRQPVNIYPDSILQHRKKDRKKLLSISKRLKYFGGCVFS